MTTAGQKSPSASRNRSGSHLQTPRKHKPPSVALYGIRHLRETVTEIARRVARKLDLSFKVDDWQAHTIHRIRQGYDSILIAGTGYGKSLIFQGLAALDQSRIVIIIAPLKALERDQVSEAKGKGIEAAMINEDTVTPALWKQLREGRHQLYYVSPEMALGPAFSSLWQDSKFRLKVQAIVVDEAHCIVEWGDSFRKEYAGLAKLRSYVGHGIPFHACTATCSSDTFNSLWTSLSFGFRPFWGLDVGSDRGNLTYIVRPLQNAANPVLDALNLLPSPIPDQPSDSSVIPKCIFYFETIEACNLAVRTLAMCLPPHLRDTVQSFTSIASEDKKKQLWDDFREGIKCRILCATDAAGMGCNIPDIKYVALFCAPQSISTLVQRWGRAGRSRDIKGTCFVFVQPWAFQRLHGSPQYTKKGKLKATETKRVISQRSHLEPALEKLINLGADPARPVCIHLFLRKHFRPHTDLNTYSSLDQKVEYPTTSGSRSMKAPRELSWTILDLQDRHAPLHQCCNFCNPALLEPYAAPNRDDARLSKYADDFSHPLQTVPQSEPATITAFSAATSDPTHHTRLTSMTSNSSNSSCSSKSSAEQLPSAIAMPMETPFIPLKGKAIKIPESQLNKLREALDDWRSRREERRPPYSFMSKYIDLPEKQLQRLVDYGGKFLRAQEITPLMIDQVATWNLASTESLTEIAAIIRQWRADVMMSIVPGSGRGKNKKARANMAHQQDPIPPSLALTDRRNINRTRRTQQRTHLPPSQPSFSPARMTPGRSISNQIGVDSPDDDLFLTPSYYASTGPPLLIPQFLVPSNAPIPPISQPMFPLAPQAVYKHPNLEVGASGPSST